MLFRSEALLCVLSLCTLAFVHGEGSEDDNAPVMRKKSFSLLREKARIGHRQLPVFESRLSVMVEQDEIQDQTTIDIAKAATDIAKVAPADPQNRDLIDNFDDLKFWEGYLYTGQVNSLPPTYAPIKATSHPTYKPTMPPTASPMTDPTYVPVPPPTFYPVKPPVVAPPTEAPACKPICKCMSTLSIMTENMENT